MNANALTEEIKEYCKQMADPVSLQKYQRFFKGGYEGYGLNTTTINHKVKQLIRDHELSAATILEATPLLMESGMYEETSFALLLLNEFEKEFSPEVFQTVGSWFSIGITNWAHADTLGMYVLPKFMSQKIVPIKSFDPWIQSPYKFQRRCVPVTLIKSLTKQNTPALLDYVTPLIHDAEREVHQGMGWFLREAWKISPGIVEDYLYTHKDTAPRLIIRYACEKMTKEQRLKYRKA